ncbi:unnamed protein product [Linum trigynum]|uniref:Uncharacterized protein n=1 Tax=Linum trigynum TaxID=586398 RepID=A0AAV2FU35_9ROSI
MQSGSGASCLNGTASTTSWLIKDGRSSFGATLICTGGGTSLTMNSSSDSSSKSRRLRLGIPASSLTGALRELGSPTGRLPTFRATRIGLASTCSSTLSFNGPEHGAHLGRHQSPLG